jgi:hypothetical protein
MRAENRQGAAFWPMAALAVLALAALDAVLHLRGIDLKIAGYDVSSPLGYIWLARDPGLAAVDWPAGSADFRFSLLMRAILWLVNATGIDPARIIWPLGFLEIIFMLVAVAYLAHVLFRHTQTTIVAAAILAICPIAGVNLGNFNAGIGLGTPVLFYMPAHGLGYLAIAFLLRARPVLAATLAALATHIHLTLGLWTVSFIAGGLLATSSSLRDRRNRAAIVIYLVLVSPLAAELLTGSSIAVSDVPVDQWVLMSRLFNWHWHPIGLGVFGPLAAIGIVPMLVLLAAYLVALRNGSRAGLPADRFLLGGIVSAAVLTALGIVFSDVLPVPALMKLAPQRTSELSSLICLLYLVHDFMRRLEGSYVSERALIAWALAILLLAAPGLAVLPIFLLGFGDALRAGRYSEMTLWGCLAGFVAGIAVMVSLSPRLQAACAAIWTPLGQLAPLSGYDLLLFGGSLPPEGRWVALAVAVGLFVVGWPRLAATRRADLFLLAGILALAIVIAQDWRWQQGAPERPRLAAFKEAQLWAAAHTAPHSVFLLDPAYPNGWREYSARASFGALAELTHYATLYDSEPGLFAKGLQRVREFGIDPLAAPHALRIPGGGLYGVSVLAPKLSQAFNRMPADRLSAIAARYCVSYLVIEPSKRTAPIDGLRLAYANAFYEIFEFPGVAEHTPPGARSPAIINGR